MSVPEAVLGQTGLHEVEVEVAIPGDGHGHHTTFDGSPNKHKGFFKQGCKIFLCTTYKKIPNSH
jgi:hypothetical protein